MGHPGRLNLLKQVYEQWCWQNDGLKPVANERRAKFSSQGERPLMRGVLRRGSKAGCFIQFNHLEGKTFKSQ